MRQALTSSITGNADYASLTTPVDIMPLPESITPVEPCTLVIFGGSGDLARRRLIPALYNLLLDGLLPSKYAVIGLGRKSHDRSRFPSYCARRGDRTFPATPVEATWRDFEPHLFYLSRGKRGRPHLCRAKSTRRSRSNESMQLPGNRIFYLSIPPSSFAAVCEGLAHAGLATRRPMVNPIPASLSKNR